MRIISGTARGTKLFSLEGDNTRPTLDRVKESLFNMLQDNIKDSVILDLFAGSGALGLEAISRGAKKTVFCDYSKEAIYVLKRNLEKIKAMDKAIILNMDYKKCIESQDLQYDFIFLDPPYRTSLVKEAICEIIKYHRLKTDGVIVVETDEPERVIKELDEQEEIEREFTITKNKKYGRVKLLWLERKG